MSVNLHPFYVNFYLICFFRAVDHQFDGNLFATAGAQVDIWDHNRFDLNLFWFFSLVSWIVENSHAIFSSQTGLSLWIVLSGERTQLYLFVLILENQMSWQHQQGMHGISLSAPWWMNSLVRPTFLNSFAVILNLLVCGYLVCIRFIRFYGSAEDCWQIDLFSMIYSGQVINVTPFTTKLEIWNSI